MFGNTRKRRVPHNKQTNIQRTNERSCFAFLKQKPPFGSISNMTNPVGICSYCRIDPQAPCDSMVAQSPSVNTLGLIDKDFVLCVAEHHKERICAMKENTTRKTNILSESEWAKAQSIAESNLKNLAKMGLIEEDDFCFDEYDEYEARQEVNKFISFRLPYVD